MRSLADIQRQLPLSPETGLSADAVTKSRAQFGANQLTPLPRQPLWQKFLEKFDEPIIKILLSAALLSMVVGLFNAGAYIVGGVALGLVVAVVALGYLLWLAQWIPSLLFF